MTICSLNEIEVYSRRAYLGAGKRGADKRGADKPSEISSSLPTSNLSWGLAEEAGRSVRYLANLSLVKACRGANNASSPNAPLNILQPLLSLLANIDGSDYDSLRPHNTSDSNWRVASAKNNPKNSPKNNPKNSPKNNPKNSPKNSLCPIIAGCTISDLASSLATRPIIIQSLFSPLLLLPFLLRASRSHALEFRVSWQGAAQEVIINIREGSLLKLDASSELLLCALAQKVVISPQKKASSGADDTELDSSEQTASIEQAGNSQSGILVRDEDWQSLQAYAARIYVPASEESRLRGAGAIGDRN